MSVVDGVIVVEAPPPGYVVNFDRPQTKDHAAAWGLYSVGNFLMILFLGQFLYVRLVLQRRYLDASVYCLIICWGISVALSTLVVHAFESHLLGVHAWEISLQNFILFEKIFTIFAATFLIMVLFGKLVLLLYYLKLSPERWWRRSVFATIGIVVCYCVSLFFAIIFACNPIEASWDITITTAVCLDRKSMYMATAFLGVVSDIILFTLPLILTVRLQMPRPQKIGLGIIFGIGSITVTTSIARVVYLFIPEILSVDATWEEADPILWAVAECCLLVICPGMTTLRPFARHIAPHIMKDYSSPEPTGANSAGYVRSYGHSRDPQSKLGKTKRVDKFGMTIVSAYGAADEESQSSDTPGFNMVTMGPSGPTKVTVEGNTSESRTRWGHGHPLKRSGSLTSHDTGGEATINRTWDPRPVDDAEAERAIVQTRTVVIQSHPNEDLMRDGKNSRRGPVI